MSRLPSSHLLAAIAAPALLVIACAAPAGSRATARATATSAPRVLLDVPLSRSIGGRTAPSPLVSVRVAKRDLRMFVDTGASHHVISASLVASLGLRRGAAEKGSDHGLHQITAFDIGHVSATVGGAPLELREVKGVRLAAMFDKAGVGGFISPQRLQRYGAVVLDFPARRMLVLARASFAQAKSWLVRRAGKAAVRSAELLRGHTPTYLYISASLCGRAPTKAVLDTGGSKTEVTRAYVGGDAPASAPTAGSAFGASGRAYKSHKLRGQQLCIAGERHDNTTLWQREHVTEAGADRTAVGLQLGYDILGQYVIVIPSEAQRPLLMARAKGR